MNMFARFDENPAMTLRVIMETKRYGRTDNVKTVYPLQTKFARGIIRYFYPFGAPKRVIIRFAGHNVSFSLGLC